MNNAITSDITAVIETFIHNDEMFSAFDITKSVRAKNLHVMHDEVKTVLNSYNWRRSYTRTLNKTLNAFVYHNPMQNPDTYVRDAVPDAVSGFRGVSGATGRVGKGTGKTVDSNGYIVPIVVDLFDKRGRYTISRCHIRDAGFVPFTYVTFDVSGNGIVIRKELDKTKKHATVDSKYNIRVLRNLFIKAFNRIPSDSELKISTSKNTITLFV